MYLRSVGKKNKYSLDVAEQGTSRLAPYVCIVEYTNSFLREHQKIVGLIFNNLSWFMQDFHCQKGVATIQPALLQKILYILKRTQDI